ncbi:hypothetical protein LCM00_21070 [Bacillus infantis]|uniref:hypothetical protein n=1 Tax=Bacillus infantis TaxID=324767 RepID=UPI001CD1E7F4|nr:hypothetical protein [Bacillus infantis]MCA1041994.1 hypothetical protein [Bacillus infantis]
MFGWDIHNSKSDRIKLFCFILAVFLVIGFTATFIFRSLGTEEAGAEKSESRGSVESAKNVDSVTSSKTVDTTAMDKNEYDQNENFSQEELAKTQEVGVAFVKAFHAYNADDPMKYLEDAKPYMTEALYKKMKTNMRREPLDRSYLTVTETKVTPVVNSSSSVVRWNVIVKGSAEATDGTSTNIEDWYLLGVRQVNGEWKVEDVRVNVPN